MNAFIDYVTAYRLNPIDDFRGQSISHLHLLGESFALWLRRERGLRGTSTDSYVSGVITTMRHANIPEHEHLRGPRLKTLIDGMVHEDILMHPARLSQRIPATFGVICVALTFVPTFFSDPLQQLEVTAIGLLTYALIMRSNEGAGKHLANLGDDLERSSHALHSELVAFKFGTDRFYPCTKPSDFPVGQQPTSVEIIQASGKVISSTHKKKRGECHKAAHRNPNPDRPCAVAATWAYVTAHPRKKGSRFFSLPSSSFGQCLQRAATSEQLDPKRLNMSSIRPGATTMVTNLTNHNISSQSRDAVQAVGGWNSNIGNHIYAHNGGSELAALTTPSLYDDGYMTIPYLRWYYMTPQPVQQVIQPKKRRR